MGTPEAPAAAPVAVVGLGCRFAGGADSPGGYWDLLIGGKDGIGDLPAARWEPYAGLGGDFAAALRRATTRGGFLADVDGFDAAFFGLSPREAELMDPQQRLLLEVTWEALEHAGLPPGDLAGTDAGVFVGIGSDDYGRRLLEDLPNIEAWTGIGAAMCAAANRISHALDLRGPSLSVDTACSSSLVATHLACQSLRLAETRVAIAAGVNLVLSPGLTLTLDAAGATAPDGRSKAFDASADGYGRGEGCGVLVLKTLADALDDGDRVLAVIRGSAVNQDGRTNGIMAPSGPAQEHVIARALGHAGVGPSTVGYVEAHGTGTKLGDPLEAGALGAVYGRDRAPDGPCRIGSVKPNIGHLEAAAGVAGLIKTVLALHHEEIPPSLHCSEPNPAVDWASSGLEVVTERTAWPRGGEPRRAGVSGFGYGGTIAHVVLEEAPEQAPQDTRDTSDDDGARLFPISAASPEALGEYADVLAGWLEGQGADAPLASVGHTLALRRDHLAHRACVVAADRDELVAGLRDAAGADAGPGATGHGDGPVWVFSGHGSQWDGMGRTLLESEPAFAATIDALEPIFQEEIGFSPRATLLDGPLDTVDRIQAMIFAMQLGLAAAWRSYGVRPAAVIGHSVGEIAAAVTAGALSFEDGARLICRRSGLLRRVAGKGAMAMAALPFATAAERLAGRGDAVAAIASSPVSTVIAGDPPAIEELLTGWADDGVPMRRVASDVAFHSPHMDPLLGELARAAADLAPREPGVPVYSTALDDPRSKAPLDGAYWAANLREPVRLAGAVQAALADGHRAFLEISAHPVVAHSIGETLSEAGAGDTFVGSSLRRGKPERETLLAAAGAVHCHGMPVDWERLHPSGGLVTLPAVEWRRRTHWRDSMPGGGGAGLAHDVDSHTLLGPPVPVAGEPLRLWRTRLDESRRPYPGSHTVHGVEILPAAVVIGTFLKALAADAEPPPLAGLSLDLPLAVDETREVQVLCDATGLRLASRAGEDGGWLTHSTAKAGDPSPPLPERLGEPAPGMAAADPGDVERHLAAVGVPSMAFAWTIEELARGEGAIRARVRAARTDNAAPSAPPTWGPMLDAALSIAPVAYPGAPVLRLAAGAAEVRLTGEPPESAIVDVTADPDHEGAVLVMIADAGGRVAGRLSGLRYAELDRERPAAAAAPDRLVHEIVWTPLDVPAREPDGHDVILVGPDRRRTDALRERLTAGGASVTVLDAPESLPGPVPPADVVVVPPSGPGAIGEAAVDAAWLLTRAAQRLAGGAARLWCLTTGVTESREEAHLAHSAVWGLGRIIGGEHPELWGGVIDVAPGGAELVLDVLRARPGEDVVSIRGGTASAARLARPAPAAPTSATSREGLRCHGDGTYLVTGGLGTLGREIARRLADRGARRIVLAGRRPVPPRSEWGRTADAETRRRVEDIRALEARGVTVLPVALDIADEEQAARVLDTDALGLPPIRGVVHAAGVLDNRLVPDVDEDSLRAVMRPKVDGALVLHRLFPPDSLDFLVMFSSCGYLLGMPGQASYGGANAFLDALAAHRRAAGCAGTVSLGWTSWRGMGMAVNEVVDAELQARGVSDISAAEAFDAWDLAGRHGGAHYAVLRTLPPDPSVQPLPLLADLPADETDGAHAAEPGTDGLADLPPDRLREVLRDEVGALIAGEMKLDRILDPGRSLVEQGLDSVMTLLVRRRLERRFGRPLPAALLWHRPTVAAIAEHLAALLNDTEPAGAGADGGPPAEFHRAVEDKPMVGA
ncbi:type I polyketide synthase [Actinomadura sp. 9N215]|uniref:type I polyketide synthase n=1 Tax=Actinomadura sp. 9N215 TaxID=3375150 RepID=UPI0037891638